MSVYLAGPINGCTDQQAHGRRDTVTGALSDRLELVTPMVRDYRGHEDENVAGIVEGDKADIESCDLVLEVGTMGVTLLKHRLDGPVAGRAVKLGVRHQRIYDLGWGAA